MFCFFVFLGIKHKGRCRRVRRVYEAEGELQSDVLTPRRQTTPFLLLNSGVGHKEAAAAAHTIDVFTHTLKAMEGHE